MAVTGDDIIVRSLNISLFVPLDLQVEVLSWRLNEHVAALKPKAFLEVLSTHVCITRNQRRVPASSQLLHNCFHQRFISRCPAFRVSEVYGKGSHTSSHIHRWLGNFPSLPGIDVTAPSSVPITGPMLLSIATKTPPDVLAILTACHIHR